MVLPVLAVTAVYVHRNVQKGSKELEGWVREGDFTTILYLFQGLDVPLYADYFYI